jgi:hypothetical protein
MKQTTSTLLSAPHLDRSIVNSVTEDEDEFGIHYNHQNVWKEHTRPKREGRLSPLSHAHFFSFSGMGGKPQHIHQNSLLPPFQGSAAPTTFLPSSRESALMDTQAYLTRYERMINEQESELSSTLSHLQPLFELLEHLTSSPQFDVCERGSFKKVNLSKGFVIRDLQQALRIIEEHDVYETVKTDKQFMTALRVLCEPETKTVDLTVEIISLGEILQCYRMCIIGMQTLDLLPTGIFRDRAKVRTLRMLSLFRPSSLSVSIPSSRNSVFATLYGFNKETKTPRQRASASKLLMSFIAGALGVLAFCMFAATSGYHSDEVNPFKYELLQKVHTKVSQEMEEKQTMTQGKDVSHPLRSSRPPHPTLLERPFTMPVLKPIESLRTTETIFQTRRPFQSATYMSTKSLRETVVDERATWSVKESLFKPEAVLKAFCSAAAGFYLLIPIVTASPSWLVMGVTVLIASPGGQAVREWVGDIKRKLVRTAGGLKGYPNDQNYG